MRRHHVLLKKEDLLSAVVEDARGFLRVGRCEIRESWIRYAQAAPFRLVISQRKGMGFMGMQIVCIYIYNNAVVQSDWDTFVRTCVFQRKTSCM